MQYLNIITWEPPQRDAVIKRFATMGVGLPAEFKMLPEYGATSVVGGFFSWLT